MIVTIPFFPGLTDYERLKVSINQRGRNDGHHLLVLSRRVDEETAMEFEESVSEMFSSSTHRAVDPPREPGRFAMSNEMLRQALTFLNGASPRPGEVQDVTLLYFDPSLRVSKKGWADRIQSEYFAKGAPQVLAVQKIQTNKMKVPWGSVLFSKDYVDRSALLAHLPGSEHWREYLRHEIGKVMVNSKTLFPRGEESVLSQAFKTPRKKGKKAETTSETA